MKKNAYFGSSLVQSNFLFRSFSLSSCLSLSFFLTTTSLSHTDIHHTDGSLKAFPSLSAFTALTPHPLPSAPAGSLPLLSTRLCSAPPVPVRIRTNNHWRGKQPSVFVAAIAGSCCQAVWLAARAGAHKGAGIPRACRRRRTGVAYTGVNVCNRVQRWLYNCCSTDQNQRNPLLRMQNPHSHI